MLNIQTYIMNGNGFTSISDYNGPVKDRLYILGSIELSVDGELLISRDLCDDINHLWPYLLHGIGALLEGQIEWSIGYPSRPFKLTFKRIATDQVMIGFDYPERRAVVWSLTEFVPTMLNAASVFFENLIRIDPNCAPDYENALQQLKNLTTIASVKGLNGAQQ